MTDAKHPGWTLHQKTYHCIGDGTEARNDWRCGDRIYTAQWRPADEVPAVLRAYKRCAECTALVFQGMG